MEIDSEKYNRVLNFVAKETAFKADRISPQTRLFHDIRIDGMDGEEFLFEFSKEFDVDMSNLVIDRHFGPEAIFNPVLWVYWMIFERDKLNASCTAWKMVPITVLDLYIASENKVFPDLSEREKE